MASKGGGVDKSTDENDELSDEVDDDIDPTELTFSLVGKNNAKSPI